MPKKWCEASSIAKVVMGGNNLVATYCVFGPRKVPVCICIRREEVALFFNFIYLFIFAAFLSYLLTTNTSSKIYIYI